MNKLEEDYSVIIDYIQKVKEHSTNIEYLSHKYKEVLLTLELANIEPETALNYIIVNLDRMKGVRDFL